MFWMFWFCKCFYWSELACPLFLRLPLIGLGKTAYGYWCGNIRNQEPKKSSIPNLSVPYFYISPLFYTMLPHLPVGLYQQQGLPLYPVVGMQDIPAKTAACWGPKNPSCRAGMSGVLQCTVSLGFQPEMNGDFTTWSDWSVGIHLQKISKDWDFKWNKSRVLPHMKLL